MIIAISNIFHNPTDNDKANVSFPTDQKLIDEARKQLAEALDEPSFWLIQENLIKIIMSIKFIIPDVYPSDPNREKEFIDLFE